MAERDVDFLLEMLQDGQEHELSEILQRSIDERGCGMTVHSRVADLRKRGWNVKNHQVRKGDGRPLSYYRLIGLKETSGAPVAASVATDVSLSPTKGSLDPPGSALNADVAFSEEEEWEALRDPGFLSDAPPGGLPEMGEQLGLLGADPHAARGAYSREAA